MSDVELMVIIPDTGMGVTVVDLGQFVEALAGGSTLTDATESAGLDTAFRDEDAVGLIRRVREYHASGDLDRFWGRPS